MVGVGSQLRRRSDGTRFDVITVVAFRGNPARMLLHNLSTGRRHWARLDNYAKKYEPCPAI